MAKSGAKAARLVGAAPLERGRERKEEYELVRSSQFCMYTYHFSPILLIFKSCHRFTMQLKKHGYSDEDVDANEGTDCDAGTSYIYAATIDKLLLHILGITLLHDINNTRRKFYQRYMPYVIVNVGTHKGNEYDAGAYDYVTGFTWAFWAQYGLSTENHHCAFFCCTSLKKHAA